ncbi:MAG: hypothetical protein AB7P34_09255 [Vicinamibacterales bacterium]
MSEFRVEKRREAAEITLSTGATIAGHFFLSGSSPPSSRACIGGGRVAALEVLLINSAISSLIREGKTFQIPSMMQVGRAQGMVALNDALMELVTRQQVEPQEAYLKAVDKAGFEGLLKRDGIDSRFVQGAAV